jgi:hypothetical protein
MKISVIVPTYNRPKALKLCVLSLADQSVRPHEVLIADDGSTSETRDIVQQLQQSLKNVFPITHVWHEDMGFRKPKILNETVRQTTGDYLIFIDGDCMAHRHFVRAHIEQSDPEAILSCSTRVEIGKRLTEKLYEEEKVLNSLSLRLLLDCSSLRGRVKHSLGGPSRRLECSIPIKNELLRKLMSLDKIADNGVMGCNFSLYKTLFMDINGCDEDFLDGSLEDTDLGIRAINQGKRLKSVRCLAIIFHLWHPSTWCAESEKFQYNLKILKKRIADKEKVCRNGIRKLM